MTREFLPRPPMPLESVYITHESKEWIRQQANIHKVSMVAVIDEMVDFCKEHEAKRRPNILRAHLGEDDAN